MKASDAVRLILIADPSDKGFGLHSVEDGRRWYRQDGKWNLDEDVVHDEDIDSGMAVKDEAEVLIIDTGVCWVTAYHRTQEYGGPEEGGWWYDESRVLATVPVAREKAEEIVELFQSYFAHIDDPQPLSNVNSRGKLIVKVTASPGIDTPVVKPHYE